MNLMYEAYTRTGDTDLARDYLALAVEASGMRRILAALAAC